MPDWHPGKDSVVGSVIPSREVLLPTVVGGDIGRAALPPFDYRSRLPAWNRPGELWLSGCAR